MNETYRDHWDQMTWKGRGQFLVDHCSRIPAQEYVRLSRLAWSELSPPYLEVIETAMNESMDCD